MPHPKSIKDIYVPFLIRLYGFTLSQLCDWTFMDDRVLRALKKSIEKNEQTKCVVHHPIPNGATYYVAVLGIDTFFDFLASGHLVETFNHFEYVDIMEDIFDSWENAGIRPRYLDRKFGESIGQFMHDFDNEEDVETASNMLLRDGARHLNALSKAFSKGPAYHSIRHSYGLEIADRLIHDRQISAFIAFQLTRLAPHKQGDWGPVPTQFVRRARWPAFVKPLIHSRDRGKCANCKVDIDGELLAKAHIDHIFSLKRGGCNDVVNLQLLCEECNLSKAASSWEVKTSVPNYHKRADNITGAERVPKFRTPWWR